MLVRALLSQNCVRKRGLLRLLSDTADAARTHVTVLDTREKLERLLYTGKINIHTTLTAATFLYFIMTQPPNIARIVT